MSKNTQLTEAETEALKLEIKEIRAELDENDKGRYLLAQMDLYGPLAGLNEQQREELLARASDETIDEYRSK